MKRFVKTLAVIFVTLFYRVRITGMENIEQNEAYLLCANHTSIMDMVFLQSKFKRWIFWMAKKELFKNPIVAWLLRKLGAFPVDRGKADFSALRAAIKILKNGEICGVFPEGTRKNQNAGKVLTPKSGAAFLAYQAKAKVLPVYISPEHHPFSLVHIVIGTPFIITKQKDEENGNGAALKESAKYIMDQIYSLKESIL